MSVTADTVRQLRERTGAGMMECKKALVETAGDLDAAAELMRKQGLAKADKKASRVAAEGAIAIARSSDGRTAAMVEVNSETDFVARGDDFGGFVAEVARAALALDGGALEPLLAAAIGGGSVDERQRALVAKIGEKISVRRHAKLGSAGHLGAYLHGSRIGALVAIEGGDDALAHDLAMHVAASNPRHLSQADVPAAEVERERGILAEQAQNDPKNQGKPAQVLAKIIEGKLAKGLSEITLLGQPFVKDPDQTVEKLVKARGATVRAFVRFEVGAGIEKKQENFAAEVMAQVSAAGRG